MARSRASRRFPLLRLALLGVLEGDGLALRPAFRRQAQLLLGEFVSARFVVVAAFFVTALVVSNIIAVKLIEMSGRIFPAGLVIFPLAYLLGDVLTEVYGIRAARRVIWLGFACNALMVAALWLGGELPAAPFWKAKRDSSSCQVRTAGGTI